MLTVEQREELDRSGITRLRGAVAPNNAQKMCDRVWSMLERRYQIRRDDPETWGARRVAGFHDLPKSENFVEIASPSICGTLDSLFGVGNWQRPERWASLLITFPESSERWTVPHKSWHLDFPPPRLQELFAVRLFVCLAKLCAGGGGTVFVAGSHRLVENLAGRDGVDRMRSADVRESLIRSCTWVKSLCSFDARVDRVRQFVKEGAVIDGIDVRVVEMTGEPGDVFVTHPLILHAGTKNCAKDPRMVLSSTVYREGVAVSALYQ